MNKQESQNQVSIIINGVKYDSEIRGSVPNKCEKCDLLVCDESTSRNAKNRTHTFFSTESHNYRTVNDILILMVDDYKISVD